jgi:hypothetical protein
MSASIWTYNRDPSTIMEGGSELGSTFRILLEASQFRPKMSAANRSLTDWRLGLCCRSGSGRIHIMLLDPDPCSEPVQPDSRPNPTCLILKSASFYKFILNSVDCRDNKQCSQKSLKMFGKSIFNKALF